MKKYLNIANLSAWMVFVITLLVISVIRDSIRSLFKKLSNKQKAKKRNYKRANLPVNYIITKRRPSLT